MSALIQLANAATGTGAQTRSSIQPVATIMPVIAVDSFVRIRLDGTGAISSTVTIETSQNDSTWASAGSFAVAGTNSASLQGSVRLDAPFVRANVTAISGTGAAVTVLLEFTPPMKV
jgi:hypothetical protein